MSTQGSTSSEVINVLVADSNQMQCQLLTAALRRRPEFRVISGPLDPELILKTAAEAATQVAIMNVDDARSGVLQLSVVRQLHLLHPEIAQILLLEGYSPETVVNAFRSGARGLFCFSRYPFRMLCKCIQVVRKGQIWVSGDQVQYLVDGLTQVSSLRVVNTHGMKLLTPREEQVVALVADGLSNRQVAHELQLSEHTVKKYLFRIFDKLGVSSRVELVLYAVSHGRAEPVEWIPAG
ncbi:MAG: hypothetical protein DMG90_07570 [Acidobacteria bacterium]|jgi:DNA-binding NarL/FixJ family response regulator|nr:MAG: hypothetical protein DMG91_02480 [Acidobacteriota bacterium]PYV91277.1 MAG: hypothetical protein DMG90_07570 [Acidobacteriota bacterium]